MFPRMNGALWPHVRASRIIQYLWLIAVLLTAFNTIDVAGRIYGVVLIWSAMNYLRELVIKRESGQGQTNTRPMSKVSRYAWTCSWTFAMILGISLVVGMKPLSLAAMHLMFIGWITTLVFGVGYRLFPIVLRKALKNEVLSFVQISAFVLGALMLIFGFMRVSAVTVSDVTIGIGGTLAAFSVLLFAFRWLLFAKAVSGVMRGPKGP